MKLLPRIEDLPLKAAALLLACFVWMYVRSEEKPLHVMSLPLEVEGLPPHLALAGDVPDSVTVRVRAPEMTLRNLSPGRFHARVEMSGAAAGEVEVPLSTDIVRGPLGVEIVRVDPASIKLLLEPRVRREVPVVARIKGRPAPGFEYDGYTLTPDRTMVEGPRSATERVREAVTDEVQIDGRNESFDVVVGVAPDRAGVRVAADSPSTLRISIRRKREVRAFADVAVVAAPEGRARPQARFRPQVVSVELEGTPEDLNAIAPGAVTAVLDLEGMGPRAAPYAVKPRIVITPGELGARVAVRSVSESTISVAISER